MSMEPEIRRPDAHRTDAASLELRYREVIARIGLLLDGETDWVAAMATVVCELHGAFDHFHWTGFYRRTADDVLVIGPYQGGHGCLRISWGKGVCGTAAASGETQLVADVREYPGHIACADSTLSEIVVPVSARDGRVFAVLDVDSDLAAAFGDVDRAGLEELCVELGARFEASSDLA